MTTSYPRGIRNNNPGNIRWSKDKWQGLVPKDQASDKSFCVFTDAKYGIRALAKILIKYGSYQGIPGVAGAKIDTVREIISRWAPPVENDTEAYISAVAKAAGVKANDAININDKRFLTLVVKAIIAHENGQNPYTDAQIAEGVSLAL